MAAAKNSRVLQTLSLLATVFIFCLPSYAQYGGGSGDANEPYLIYTAEQMNAIGGEPNDWDKHFKLMADIDLKDFAESSFNLIGSLLQPFKGVFNGNGHTIRNFSYVVTGDEFVRGNENEADPNAISGFGLFRSVNDPNALISDLILVNPDLRPASTCQKRVFYVGALAGSIGQGSISNCSVDGGQVKGDRWVGGLIGSNRGTISECSTTCTVGMTEERPLESMSTSLDRRNFFGGLAGETSGMISNSWSGSEVSGEASIGGLVGKSRRPSRLSNCYSSGHVSGENSIGGLVGTCSKESTIEKCYSTGSVDGDEQAGGLVGWHEGTISECYVTAFVTADSNEGGGLAGLNGGTIRTSCAHGYVTGKNKIGGLVGWNWQSSFLGYDPVVTDSYGTGAVRGEDFVGGLTGANQGGTISHCYSTGRVRVTGATADPLKGGLVGADSGGKTENSFWDTVTSGLDTSDGGEGKSTSEMQNMWMYFDAGWDFKGEMANGTDDVWKMCCGRPVYPKLSWEQVLAGDFVEPEGVDFRDLAFLAEHWLATVGLPCNSPDLTVDGRIDIKDFSLMAHHWRRGAKKVIFDTSLDEPQGWTAEGQWQFGQPQGSGGSGHGYPDPTSGYTGDNVYGVNLQGDYSIDVGGPHYLTAGPFDCRLYSDVEVQFARQLNTDGSNYVRATIEFSVDGTRWATIWEHEDTEVGLTDDVWQNVVYRLGAMADNRERIYIRWGYEIRDVEAWPMSGWNIDDVKLSGRE